MRETLILHLPDQPDGLCHWRIHGASPDESSEQTASGRIEEALVVATEMTQARIVVLVPTEKLVLTHVDLPVRQQSKLLQIVPYALEEKLAQDIEDLHFALGPRQSDGTTPVAVVANEQMTFWTTQFSEVGLQPSLMIPDVLALPYKADQNSVCIGPNGHCLVRTGALAGFSVPLDLLEFSLQQVEGTGLRLLRTVDAPSLPAGLSIAHSETIESLLDGLRDHAESATRINLLQGAYAPRKASDQWLRAARLPAALAASWLVFASVTMALGNHQLRVESEQLRDRAQQSFSKAFPEITRIVDMRVQAEQQLERLRGGSGAGAFMLLLSQASPALVATKDLKLDGAQFREGSLYLNLSGTDLQALERLRAEFSKITNLKLDVQSAQAGSDGVQIRLKVDQA